MDMVGKQRVGRGFELKLLNRIESVKKYRSKLERRS